MVKRCRKCGRELEDGAEFCKSCGFQVKNDPASKTKPAKSFEDKLNAFKNYNSRYLRKLPLTLAVIAIFAAVCEGLATPIIIGLDRIMLEMATGVLASLIGIYLMEKTDEPVIAACEFIVTAILIFILIGGFGEISAILFIITGISVLCIRGLHSSNWRLWSVPVLTFALVLVALMAGGLLTQMSAEDYIAVGNITQNITYDGHGHYIGEVCGDIRVEIFFDYLEVTVSYYDNDGKLIDSTVGWNESDPNSAKTYHFEGKYFHAKKPATAEIRVVDSQTDKTPLYTENIPIITSSYD